MRNPSCGEPLGTQQLLAYWLDELDEFESGAIEQHLFACAVCSTSLERVIAVAEGIRELLAKGEIGTVLPACFVRTMKAAGLRLREYRLEPQTSVNCTVTPEDDLVLAHRGCVRHWRACAGWTRSSKTSRRACRPGW